tara:strand:- start:1484 stop:1783 length:300 start_codon:yes stop_codon:yes gene_type:complete
MRTSKELIAERNNYGDPRENHQRIAGMWSAWLGKRITAYEVAVMMSMVKLSRMKGDPSHDDNFDDAVAYLQIAQQIVDQDISESLFEALYGAGTVSTDD